MIKNRILIVGGAGFLGFNLIKKINKNKNFKIDTIVKKSVKKNKKIKNVNYINCDISNLKSLKKNLEKSEYSIVINLSGNIDHNNHIETKKVHFVGLKNLVNIFKKKHLKLFIQIGSCLEYGKKNSPQSESSICNPISSYGKSKYMASQYLRKFNKNYLILRPYQIYGPFQKDDRLIPFIIKSCIKNKSFPCSEGSQLRDFLYIDDFTNLIIKIIKRKKYIYGNFNVGFGRPTKVKNVIGLITKIIKKGTANFGRLKMRKDEIHKLYPSIKKVKKTFKWKPKTNLKNGIKKTINFYKNETKFS